MRPFFLPINSNKNEGKAMPPKKEKEQDIKDYIAEVKKTVGDKYL